MQWQISVHIHAPGVTAEQASAIGERLGVFAVISHDLGHGRFSVTFDIEAPTARRAADDGLRDLANAIKSEVGSSLPVTAVHVLAEPELLQPSTAAIVGSAEAAEMLGVKRQRVHELAKSHPEFPAPIARLSTGPIYSAKSIDEFNKRWERRQGRPRKTSA